MGYTHFITTACMLRMLSNKEKLERFLANKHIKHGRTLLPGIKLIFKFILDENIHQIERGNGFALESDRMTHRAIFVGLDIGKISSNSQLAKVLRGLRYAESIVLKSRSISEFLEAILREFGPWFSAIEKLWSRATDVFDDELHSLRKTDVRTLQIFSSLLMLLNIKHHLLGHLRFDQEWRKNRKKERERFWEKGYPRCFLGYRVAVAYLWDSFSNKYTPSPPVDEVLATNDWIELDGIYRRVADGVVAEADKILGDSFENAFFKTREYFPKELIRMMKEADSDRKLFLSDRLDESFLWYDIELLDTAGKKLFTGVPTFVNILRGAIATKREFQDDATIEVRRLLHPGNTEANDISYAILIPMYGNFSDYSGWLVTLFCATDHSGFGNSMRRYAEEAISQFSSDISISDIHIQMNQFRTYLKRKLKKRSERGVWSYTTPTENEILRFTEAINVSVDLSAIVIELYMALNYLEQGFIVEWRYRNEEVLQDNEIDVLAYNDESVHIVECSRGFPTNEDGRSSMIAEIKRKRDFIQQTEFSRKNVTLRFITSKDFTREPFLSTSKYFKKEGIQVENIFEILDNSRHNYKPLRDLLLQVDDMRDTSSTRLKARELGSTKD